MTLPTRPGMTVPLPGPLHSHREKLGALADMGYTDVASMKGGFQAWKSAGLDFETPVVLSGEQKQRYSRHLLIPEVGSAGQATLLGSKALLIGAGGLGSPAALYLAAAGVGTIGLVDFDVVDLSNLQRQIVHTTARVGERKVESAKIAINALNPDVNVVLHEEMLVAANVERLIAGYDVILDGTDTFETRYILNDAAVAAGIPVVHASVFRFEGQLTTFIPFEGPCYRCLYPTPPPPELVRLLDVAIVTITGPEVVTGSTRLKAGTATKMVLNMITTGAMVRLGKTYGNLMVDLRATNVKLVARSRRIVAMLTGLSEADAEVQLANCQGELKTAIVAARRGVSPEVARQLLRDANGQLRGALDE